MTLLVLDPGEAEPKPPALQRSAQAVLDLRITACLDLRVISHALARLGWLAHAPLRAHLRGSPGSGRGEGFIVYRFVIMGWEAAIPSRPSVERCNPARQSRLKGYADAQPQTVRRILDSQMPAWRAAARSQRPARRPPSRSRRQPPRRRPRPCSRPSTATRPPAIRFQTPGRASRRPCPCKHVGEDIDRTRASCEESYASPSTDGCFAEYPQTSGKTHGNPPNPPRIHCKRPRLLAESIQLSVPCAKTPSTSRCSLRRRCTRRRELNLLRF